MKVPDELRDALQDVAEDGGIERDYKRAVRDWFAGKTLVDLTLCGPPCPAYQPAEVSDDPADVGAEWLTPAMCDVMLYPDDLAPTGHPCPVLAAREGE